MNVLSLFDGISGAMLALERANVKVDSYYSSEIDKYALQISNKHYPNIIRLGDIKNWKDWDLQKIDLIIGGSPCTNLSIAGDRSGLKGVESSLFYDFVDVLNHYNPKYFLLENVKMKSEWVDAITEYMKVEPILINSATVSAQHRERYYWTNIPNVEQPEDSGIMLKDIVFDDVYPVALHNLYGGFKERKVRVFEGRSPTIRTAKGGGHIPHFVKKDLLYSEKAIAYMNRKVADGRTHWDFGHHSDIRNDKSSAVVANFFKGVPYNVFKDWDCIRKFHPIECERLQTLPDNYTEGVSNTQRYNCIGNGFTVDVVAHILSYLPDKKE